MMAAAAAATTTSGLGRKLMKGLQTKTRLPKNSSNQLKTALGSQETAQNGSKWLKMAPNWKWQR